MRYVIAVAETRSFTRAAARCYVVQSALSHQVKALEDELGVRLFARTSRRVELTDAGAAFLPAARASIEAAQRAAADAVATTGEVRGSVTIGMIPTVTAVDVPGTLAALRRAHPAVRVSLRTGSSDALLSGIRSREVDVAFIGLPEGAPIAGVDAVELSRERLVAVLWPGHRLARRRRLRLADLEDEPFADFPSGTPGRSQSDLAFDAAGVARSVAYESMGGELIVALVEERLAVALMPRAIVAARAGVVAAEVSDGPSRVQYLAWSSFNPGAAASAFVAVVRAHEPAP